MAQVQIKRTKVSQNVRKIEDDLITKYNKIVDIIKKDPVKDISLLQRGYGSDVSEATRAAVQQIYLEGLDYVGNHHDIETFLTDIDLKTIKDISAVYSERFWLRLRKFLQTITPDSLLFSGYTPNFSATSNLNPNKVMTSIATQIATYTLAAATLSKSRQIKLRNRVVTNQKHPFANVRTAAIKAIERNLPYLPSTITNIPVQHVTWTTSGDAAVCPICAELEGQSWEVNDPNIPMPGGDFGASHWNCRCRLVLEPLDLPPEVDETVDENGTTDESTLDEDIAQLNDLSDEDF